MGCSKSSDILFLHQQKHSPSFGQGFKQVARMESCGIRRIGARNSRITQRYSESRCTSYGLPDLMLNLVL